VKGDYFGILVVSRDDHDPEKIKIVCHEITREKVPRYGHSANIHNDILLVFGGVDLNHQYLENLSRYNLATGSWENQNIAPNNLFSAVSKPSPRRCHQSQIYKGYLYIYGGLSPADQVLDDLWRIDLRTFNWEKVSPSSPSSSALSTFTNEITILSTVYENNLIFTSELPTPNFFEFIVFSIDENNKVSPPQSKSIPLKLGKYPAPHFFEVYDNKIMLGRLSDVYTLTLENPSSSPQISSRPIRVTYQETIRRQFEEKPFADIVFKVQGTPIKAHKGLISTRCPYFQRMFSSGMMETKSKEIEIHDITPATFNTVLEWIYCDYVNRMDENIAQELFAVADKFSLFDLKKLAEKCMMDHLTVGNVVERAELAEIFEASTLERATIKFMISNIDAVFAKSDIRRLSDNILLKVCKGAK